MHTVSDHHMLFRDPILYILTFPVEIATTEILFSMRGHEGLHLRSGELTLKWNGELE